MAPEQEQPKRAATVLVIDDEPDIRKLVRFVLEREGYRVLTADNGAAGLTVSRAEHPDTIILDVMMPVMNGHEVLRQLKADPATKDIPVIMLTALGAEQHVKASLQFGAVYHMEKPFQSKELAEEVKVAVWKHRNAHSATSIFGRPA